MSRDGGSKSKAMGLGLGAVALLGLAGWLATRAPEQAVDADPKAAGEVGAAAVIDHVGAPPARLPEAPDASAPELVEQAEVAPTEAPEPPPPPVDDAPNQGDGDGPEAAPFAIPQVESRVEREMSFAEKAGQTRVMVSRVRERAGRVETRLAEAQRSGDAADIHLQEVLLQRLRQRTTQLTRQAEHEEQQAAQELAEGSEEEAAPRSEPDALEQDPSRVP